MQSLRFAKKQQIPIIYSLAWCFYDSTTQSAAFEASTANITPTMQFIKLSKTIMKHKNITVFAHIQFIKNEMKVTYSQPCPLGHLY
jgi:hypothetical protein